MTYQWDIIWNTLTMVKVSPHHIRQGGFATVRVGSPPLQEGSTTLDLELHTFASVCITGKYDLSNYTRISWEIHFWTDWSDLTNSYIKKISLKMKRELQKLSLSRMFNILIRKSLFKMPNLSRCWYAMYWIYPQFVALVLPCFKEMFNSYKKDMFEPQSA